MDISEFACQFATENAKLNGFEDRVHLVTCSCGHHVLPSMYMELLVKAQKDAHVQLRQVEWRTQGRDHPILPSSPETQYLKCRIFRCLSPKRWCAK